jgi:hypothetical protein
MATRRWSIARGKQHKDVTEAAGIAIVTAALELTYDLAGAWTRNEVLAGLEQIKQYIINDDFPPA